jgi:hypothetical protein
MFMVLFPSIKGSGGNFHHGSSLIKFSMEKMAKKFKPKGDRRQSVTEVGLQSGSTGC